MKTLIIAPHADDEILGCSSVMQKYHKNVDVLILTDEKEKERTYQACFECGVEPINVTFVDFPDNQFYKCFSEIKDCLESEIRVLNPEQIYYPYLDGNQDHRVVHEAVEVATRRYYGQRYLYNVNPRLSFLCSNTYIELDWEEKKEALKFYDDRIKPSKAPLDRKSIKLYNQLLGVVAGLDYAEEFKQVFRRVRCES